VAELIYSAITSLDGYIEDEHGKFDWAAPGEEVHTFINELERSVGTYLYGRRMYETMVAWEDTEAFADQPPYMREFAQIWQAADKVVYSRTLERALSDRTRIAAQAIAAQLVDEIHLFLAPIVVGGGNPSLPSGVRVELELIDERRFGSGFVYLRYRT
jgi:dihydrofolate reductase